MLILAAVTISTIINGGLFDQAKNAKNVTEMEAAREKVNILLGEYGTEKHANGKTFEEFFTAKIGTEIDSLTTNSGTYIIGKDGYLVTVDADTLTIGTISKEGSLPSRPILEITQTTFSKEHGVIEIVWLDQSNNVVSNAQAPVLGGLTPIKWTGAPGSYVEVATTEGDAAWYSYTAQTGATTNGGTSKWANAKAVNGSNEVYFVWIPRYAYKITYFDTLANKDAYRNNPSSTAGIIGYSNVDGIVNVQVTPGVEKLVEGTAPKNLVGTVKTSGYEEYIVHPAFNFDGAKKGLWVGKYESGYAGATNLVDAQKNEAAANKLIIKPNAYAWTYIEIKNAFATSQGVKDIYSLTGDTHMMKNTEWGAVAYLTDSKYGRNGTEVCINNSIDYITGNSAGDTDGAGVSGTANKYNTVNGVLASTTGNVYGIYDISGGATEHIMGALVNGTIPTVGTSGFSTFPDSKYYNLYERGETPSDYESNYNKNAGIKGDALYETTKEGTYGSWNGGYSYYLNASSPWLVRGGDCADGANAGEFAYSGYTGENSGNVSFRVTISL